MLNLKTIAISITINIPKVDYGKIFRSMVFVLGVSIFGASSFYAVKSISAAIDKSEAEEVIAKEYRDKHNNETSHSDYGPDRRYSFKPKEITTTAVNLEIDFNEEDDNKINSEQNIVVTKKEQTFKKATVIKRAIPFGEGLLEKRAVFNPVLIELESLK